MVNAELPYTKNKLDDSKRIRNEDDFIYNEEGANGYTQEAEIQYLGDSILDGLLAYISVGIDVYANYSMTMEMGGGGPGGMPPGGAFPSGAMPPGAMPSGTMLPPTSSVV